MTDRTRCSYAFESNAPRGSILFGKLLPIYEQVR